MAIARLNSNGATDTTFANNQGKYSHAIGTGDVEAYDFVAQADGKLLLSAKIGDGSGSAEAAPAPEAAAADAAPAQASAPAPAEAPAPAPAPAA